MTEIVAQNGPRQLIYRHPYSRGWHSFKLTHATGFKGKRGPPKRSWRFMWNGLRLARDHDALDLAQSFPEVEAWMREQLMSLTFSYQPFPTLGRDQEGGFQHT